jgi:hypothetical protein
VNERLLCEFKREDREVERDRDTDRDYFMLITAAAVAAAVGVGGASSRGCHRVGPYRARGDAGVMPLLESGTVAPVEGRAWQFLVNSNGRTYRIVGTHATCLVRV